MVRFFFLSTTNSSQNRRIIISWFRTASVISVCGSVRRCFDISFYPSLRKKIQVWRSEKSKSEKWSNCRLKPRWATHFDNLSQNKRVITGSSRLFRNLHTIFEIFTWFWSFFENLHWKQPFFSRSSPRIRPKLTRVHSRPLSSILFFFFNLNQKL